MQHAVALSGEEDEQVTQATSYSDIESNPTNSSTSHPIKQAFSYAWLSIKYLFHLLHPSTITSGYKQLQQMTLKEMIKNLYLLFIQFIRLLLVITIYAAKFEQLIFLNEIFKLLVFSLLIEH